MRRFLAGLLVDKILVVAEDAILRVVLAHALVGHGFGVIPVRTVADALRLVATHRPCLVVILATVRA